jgi:Domain of unknown function (DUF4352)
MKSERLSMRLQKRWISILLVVGLLGFSLLAGWRSSMRPVRLTPIGKPLRFDDFAFSIEHVTESPSSDSPPGKRNWIVRLRVNNQAKRVSYTLNQNQVVLVAANGESYRPEAAGLTGRLRSSDDALSASIPAGVARSTDLTYELPEEVEPVFVYLDCGLIGNALDTIISGRQGLSARSPAD